MGARTSKSKLRVLLALCALLGRRMRSLLWNILRDTWQGWGLLRNVSLHGILHWCGLRLRRWHGIVACILAWQSLRLTFKSARYLARLPHRNALWKRLHDAATYEEWSAMAREWDAWSGYTTTKPILSSEEEAHFRGAIKVLRIQRKSGKVTDLMFALRMDLRRAGNFEFMQRGLDSGAQVVPMPSTVRAFLDEVACAFSYIVHTPVLSKKEKISFFREMRHAYGRTALVLSGGGSFGFFHFGVIRALMKSNLLPRIVSGSSAGALGASILTTRPESLTSTLVDSFPGDINMNLLSNEGAKSVLHHLVTKGTIQDTAFFIERLQRVVGSDITFAEAYSISGRVLNVAVCAADTREPPRLLNYLTAPHVLVWSAVACSSAFPFLFTPQDLLARDPNGHIVRLGLGGNGGSPSTDLRDTSSDAGPSREGPDSVSINGIDGCSLLQRRWRDGSLEEDLPMRGVGETFNVNHFVVSQANPWVLPVLSLQSVLPRWLGTLLEAEFKHRCAQALALFPRSAVLKMMCQPWGGDITLTMPNTVFPAGKAAQNFSPADIRLAMQEGQLRVWRAQTTIEAACAVELAIDAALDELLSHDHRMQDATHNNTKPRTRRRVSRSCRGKLPSWLHLGLMPPSASGDTIYTDVPVSPRSPAGPSRVPSVAEIKDTYHILEDRQVIMDEDTSSPVNEEEEARHAWADVAVLTVGGAACRQHASSSQLVHPPSCSALDFIAI